MPNAETVMLGALVAVMAAYPVAIKIMWKFVNDRIVAAETSALMREKAASDEVRRLGERITELEDRQFEKLLDMSLAQIESQKRHTTALNCMVDAMRHAPCGSATLDQALSGTITPV